MAPPEPRRFSAGDLGGRYFRGRRRRGLARCPRAVLAVVSTRCTLCGVSGRALLAPAPGCADILENMFLRKAYPLMHLGSKVKVDRLFQTVMAVTVAFVVWSCHLERRTADSIRATVSERRIADSIRVGGSLTISESADR